MVNFEGLPAWARRRLSRRFARGASERIVRWMSLPAGGAARSAEATTAPGNVVAFVPRPDAVPTYEERPRIAAAG